MNILMIGDVVGSPGRTIMRKALPSVFKKYEIDYCIANVENAAGGFGVTEAIMEELSELPINAYTSGNHIWDKKEFVENYDRYEHVIRPANYPAGNPGKGKVIRQTAAGVISSIKASAWDGSSIATPQLKSITLLHDASLSLNAGLSIADMTAGAHLCQGVLAMLVRRAATGRGGRVDVSLFESVFDLQFEQFTAFLNSSRSQPPRDQTNSASVYLGAPYGVYKTADGYLAIAMTPIERLGALLGCAPLQAYGEPSAWFRERATIKALLAEHLAAGSTQHWLAILEPADVWCATSTTAPSSALSTRS